MRYIFIGFYGWLTDSARQTALVETIEENFECWDLKKCTIEEFVESIKKKISPINDNVLRNYIATEGEDFGISRKLYNDCSWGLLLPDPSEQGNSFKEIISVLNLFSTSFMRPAFYVSDFGISTINKKVFGNWLHAQDKAVLFKSSNFIEFYKKMISTGKYFQWFRDNVLTWGDEDWRLYMAAIFYDDLVQYENSKSIYTWQRESADTATLLETLLTAGESEKEEIGYRLRKRAFALIGWHFPTIEKDIKDLYGDRSDFVHGNFYKKIVKAMRKNKEADPAMPPSPDFRKLYTMKEKVRFLLVAYLYLHEIKTVEKNNIFSKYKNVQQILEESILDMKLRGQVKNNIKSVVNLLPKSQNGYS